MSHFKVNILFKFVEGPWGGGNQFLKALRNYFLETGIYEEDPKKAEIILFNSHHLLKEVYNLKKRYPDKILVHRVDGPVFLVRGSDMHLDRLIFVFNGLFADGTVFQSQWSKLQCQRLGLSIEDSYYTVIMNAPDPHIFNPQGKKPFNSNKIKLIATSWSPNYKKGFDVYRYLDTHLDFSRYELTFIGNLPVTFQNIQIIKPLPSDHLAFKLKDHDIYIAASQDDPCSNALIEALHCGLPAVARKSGGHPEIVKHAGEFFHSNNDVIPAIEKVAKNYHAYQKQINLPTLAQIGDMYIAFMRKFYNAYTAGLYQPKRVSLQKSLILKCRGLINLLYKVKTRL